MNRLVIGKMADSALGMGQRRPPTDGGMSSWGAAAESQMREGKGVLGEAVEQRV